MQGNILMLRAHIFYSGSVQGVGFRYTVERYALDLDLKGWVRNLPDQRVELIVEGSQEKIDELCQRIDAHFQGYIRGQEQELTEVKGEFEDFKVRV